MLPVGLFFDFGAFLSPGSHASHHCRGCEDPSGKDLYLNNDSKMSMQEAG